MVGTTRQHVTLVTTSGGRQSRPHPNTATQQYCPSVNGGQILILLHAPPLIDGRPIKALNSRPPSISISSDAGAIGMHTRPSACTPTSTTTTLSQYTQASTRGHLVRSPTGHHDSTSRPAPEQLYSTTMPHHVKQARCRHSTFDRLGNPRPRGIKYAPLQTTERNSDMVWQCNAKAMRRRTMRRNAVPQLNVVRAFRTDRRQTKGIRPSRRTALKQAYPTTHPEYLTEDKVPPHLHQSGLTWQGSPLR